MPLNVATPELMLAIAIWLLALLIFAVMLLIVFITLISENWPNQFRPKTRLKIARRRFLSRGEKITLRRKN
jgi:hypothetical protein